MDLLLQLWGGSFYLINKILFAVAEGKSRDAKRNFKLYGWTIYILGVPAWGIILFSKQNWIAASIELGGIPAMIFGLFNVYKRIEKADRSISFLLSIITYFFIILGTGYSFYENHGLHSISQLLEIGVTIGFLMGSYLLAKNNLYGWLFFALMNLSMGCLMAIQMKPILAIQQVVSLSFVIYGFIGAYREKTRLIETVTA